LKHDSDTDPDRVTGIRLFLTVENGDTGVGALSEEWKRIRCDM
jgi:hypothetical protein